MKKISKPKALKAPVRKSVRPAGKKQAVGYKGGVGAGIYRSSRSDRSRTIYLPVPQDAKIEATSWDHLRLMSMSRILDANVGFVTGPVNDICTYAVSDGWVPVFEGDKKYKQWGHDACEALKRAFNVIDVTGKDFTTVMWQVTHACIIDGDHLVILTEAKSGYPQIQTVPAHRIAGCNYEQWGSNKVWNGVVLNSVNRPIGWLIKQDDGTPAFVSAKDGIFVAGMKKTDQIRGLPAYYSVLDTQDDIDDVNTFEKFAVKLYAALAFKEIYEDSPSEGQDFLSEKRGDDEVEIEEVAGGMFRRFRAGSGANIEPFEHNRPSPNVREFVKDLKRDCFAAISWPLEMYDPSGLRGANNRQITARAERTIRFWQRVIGRMVYRVTCYVIAKLIKLNVIQYCDDWYKWDFQLPKKVSVDEGREAQADRDDLKAGVTTLSEIYGKKGMFWVTETDQWLDELKFIVDGAKERQLDPMFVLAARGITNTPVAKPNNTAVEKDDTEEENQ